VIGRIGIGPRVFVFRRAFGRLILRRLLLVVLVALPGRRAIASALSSFASAGRTLMSMRRIVSTGV
jgi:hypothetical protein